MEWVEIDWGRQEWRIPAKKMKSDRDHIVPLSSQCHSLLKEQYDRTGHLQFAFPSPSRLTRHLSDGALRVALRGLGFEKDVVTPHGFRATARTLLDEELHVRPDLIEHQLAHKVKDVNGRAYNRTSFLEARREMMQVWSDYLNQLKLLRP